MGYQTEFTGAVDVEPPLNRAEVAYLQAFAQTRRMNRRNGPYFVDPDDASRDRDAVDPNNPPTGQPGLWCDWEPNDEGTEISWNDTEKFYEADKWMAYLIDHFLRPDAHASTSDDPQFSAFTFDHVVNGTIHAEGDDSDDVWNLVVRDNVVTVAKLGDAEPEPVDASVSARVLACPMADNDADAATVGDYLFTLLALVWQDGEGFDGKRPFGNSSWEYEVFEALAKAGLIEATLDEDGYIEDFDRDVAEELVADAIKTIGAGLNAAEATR